MLDPNCIKMVAKKKFTNSKQWQDYFDLNLETVGLISGSMC